jgi:hypothetical protein
VVAGVRRRRHRPGNLNYPKKNFFDQKNILRHFESESTLKNPKSLTKTTGSEWKVWNFVLFLSFSLLLFLFQFVFDFVWEVVD